MVPFRCGPSAWEAGLIFTGATWSGSLLERYLYRQEVILMARKPGSQVPTPLPGPLELVPLPTGSAVSPDPSRLRSLARLALRLVREGAQAQTSTASEGNDNQQHDSRIGVSPS